MSTPTSALSGSRFDDLDPLAAAGWLTEFNDVAVVLDLRGTVVDVQVGIMEGELPDMSGWVGRSITQLVTTETRGKAEALVTEAAQRGQARRRQVNHTTPGGVDVPILYTAVRTGGGKRLLLVGRDLRAVAALQQRLVSTQEALERDYWRLRHAETRYRLLFQMASEGILILDADRFNVVDANRAAVAMLARPAESLLGQTFPFDVAEEDRAPLAQMLTHARANGRAEAVRARLAHDGSAVSVSATCFRQDQSTVMLVRMAPIDANARAPFMDVLERSPDAFVVTDLDGVILTANAAFLELAQLPTPGSAVGTPLARWLGHEGADVPTFLATLRQSGVVRLASSTARGRHGTTSHVEVSAVWAADAEVPCAGFVIRDIARRPVTGPEAVRDLSRAVEQLTRLVGQVSLRELVRDTVDLVERHFIAAALDLTRNNRTSAAEVLGVSRQSLYVKLRRYQLTNGTQGDADDDAAS